MICHFKKETKELTIKLETIVINSKYPGAAHAHCNLNIKQSYSSFIPKASHNMTNHYSNLFIKELINRKAPKVNFKVIPQTDEKLISITSGRLGIIDPINFMKMSLDKLGKAMDLDDFIHTRKISGDKWEVFTRKTSLSL